MLANMFAWPKAIRWLGRTTIPGWFVFTTWFLMTAAVFYYLRFYMSPYLYWDEWEIVPVLTSATLDPSWLWEQHMEHRIPLSKAVFLATGWLVGPEPKLWAGITACLLSGLALTFILLMRRVRGHTDYVDAAFPIALLNWGHYENLTWGFQLAFGVSVSLICLWLITCQRGPTLSAYFSACACTILLPLCGSQGLVFVPPIAAWLGWMAVREFRTDKRRLAFGIGTVALAGAAFIALYFLGLKGSPPLGPQPRTIPSVLRTALEVISTIWGQGGTLAYPITMIAGLAFLAVFVVALGIAWRRWPMERPRVGAFAALLVGTVLLVLGIGWGRSSIGPGAGLVSRYSLLVTPLLLAGFILWTWIGGRFGNRLIPGAIALGVCIFLPQDCINGLECARKRSSQLAQFGRELKAGASPETLAAKHHANVYPDARKLAHRLRSLRAAGYSRYGKANELADNREPTAARPQLVLAFDPESMKTETAQIYHFVNAVIEHLRYWLNHGPSVGRTSRNSIRAAPRSMPSASEHRSRPQLQ